MIFTLQILCILGMVAIGYIARRRNLLTAQGTHDLARVSIAFIYPALVFSSIVRLDAADLRANMLMPVLVSGIALAGLTLGLLAIRFMGRIPQPTARAFLFHCLINNYLFLPLPLVLFRYGEKGVALLVFSSLGYEIILWTLGVALFNHRPNGREAFRAILSPPFLALLAGVGVILCRSLLPAWAAAPPTLQTAGAILLEGLRDIGAATIAISMIVAGSRFAMLKFHVVLDWRLWVLSAIRLVAIPALLLPLFLRLPLNPVARGILVIIAVMPSAMVSTLFSERYGGDTDFIAGGLLLTHLWALLTVPLILAIAL